MAGHQQRLVRIGVFYDGNFFYRVSTYYKYAHARAKRISIPGLHDFIRHQVAEAEKSEAVYCSIVESHFFRGRLSARAADARQQLYAERAFDDVLMGEGVVTHYLPMRHGEEKGIDVSLALEAYEGAVHRQFDVLVIVGGDSDFVPLLKKVNSLGVRVMVLGWGFKYTDEQGQERETVVSDRLFDAATYPVMMNMLIDAPERKDDPLIKNLFVERRSDDAVRDTGTTITINVPVEEPEPLSLSKEDVIYDEEDEEVNREVGEIMSLQQGFGFIRSIQYPNNVFFHWSAVTNRDFLELERGQKVSFVAEIGEKGPVAKELEVIE